MPTFAKLRKRIGRPSLECAHNRELEREIDPSLLYFVLSDEIHEKFNVDQQHGEVLLYSPYFSSDLSCTWVGQRTDFDYITN